MGIEDQLCDRCNHWCDATINMFGEKWCKRCVDTLVGRVCAALSSVPLLVWSGYSFDPDPSKLHDPDEGTVLGGVALDVFCADGSVYTFESCDDEVELAAACADAIEGFFR